jgi:hypothetical protein
MNFGRFKLAAKIAILACFTIFVVLPLLVGCVWGMRDWRYTRFCWRGQQYYAQVADACDQVINLSEPLPRDLRGDRLESLPVVLRELRPSYATVDTNIILLRVGPHLILWKTDDGSSWDLITADPEVRTSVVRFSTKKAFSANPASAAGGGERLRQYTERMQPAATDSKR